VTLGTKGIRVNSISPGTVLKEESRRAYLQNEKLMNLYRRLTPLERMGTAEDVAHVVEFLCSPKSSFLTGQDIVVDGGLSLQLQEALVVRLEAGQT
jgi:NAD(P)-dependent dehydrogenase (short-subunit alcohol dehydrogenase family)